MRPEGEIKKGPTAFRARWPFTVPSSCTIGKARLYELYQRAAFCANRSGFSIPGLSPTKASDLICSKGIYTGDIEQYRAMDLTSFDFPPLLDTSDADIIADFFVPALGASVRYDRGVLGF
jgi:hypothetical protein